MIDNIVFGGIDHKDYPDFCDAFIESADSDGMPMTEDEIDALNNNREFIYEQLMLRI